MAEPIITASPSGKATFIVQIQYQQKANWHGKISWAEEKKTQSFRSLLEMIQLMNEAVSPVEVEDAPRTWE
ncbi:hypothetical protein U6B65_08880 [Oscillospiraceae bacterium MB08-C2-2]|nr:hypothetical protein U6B65_08880 [Oscillospiraceae bacterium MB08-C2-2]